MLVSEETGPLQAIYSLYAVYACQLELDKECTGNVWAFPIPVT